MKLSYENNTIYPLVLVFQIIITHRILEYLLGYWKTQVCQFQEVISVLHCDTLKMYNDLVELNK